MFCFVFFSSVQKFAGANKLQQSGNRSMSYLAGKAERCVVSLLSSEHFHACALQLWAKRSYCPLLLWEHKHMFNGKRLRHSLTSV